MFKFSEKTIPCPISRVNSFFQGFSIQWIIVTLASATKKIVCGLNWPSCLAESKNCTNESRSPGNVIGDNQALRVSFSFFY
jgi:hypothetical protein